LTLVSTERRVENEVIRAEVDSTTYLPQEEMKKVARRLTELSFGCPIGNSPCGQIDEIVREYSDKNVFVAIPYSNYRYENTIREVLTKGTLLAKVAKDKITSQIILCKICKEMRKCSYGIMDISRNTANVIYELGLMQSLGKKCAILLSTSKRMLCERPTDLQGIENVTYRSYKTLKRKLARWLIDNVQESDISALKEYL